ncbi:MAG: nuclear transport factor 2 family protein [Candidatus Hydrogenedentes bacterium]|nr:nuclear transport factor 2 family protein [Candidatus Hydrogenedentota bacterium]
MAADVRAFLDTWRAAVDADDQEKISALLSDEMTFYSPVIFKPSSDRVYIDHVLQFVADSISDFTYTEEYQQENGAALVFAGNVGELEVEGVDLFKLDDAGRVVELKVLLRPLNTVMILAQNMKAKFAAMQA